MKVLTYAVLIATATLSTANSAELKISQRLIKRAVEHGLKHADMPDEQFLSEWLAKPKNVSKLSVDNAAVATIFTPFMQFAYFAHAEKRAPANKEEVALADSVRRTINFRILCFGSSSDFPKSARAELLVVRSEAAVKKRTVLKPEKIGGSRAELLPPGATLDDGSRAYGGAVFCSFDAKNLAGNETLVLKVREASRNISLEYEFDLKKIR